MTLSVVAWSSALKAWSTYGLGSRVRRNWKLFVLMTSHWNLGLAATPAACTLVCPHTATLSCPRRRSAVLGDPLLAGPLVT